jgi:hypothetical protein
MRTRYILLAVAIATFTFAIFRYYNARQKPENVFEHAAPTDIRFPKTLMDVGAQKYHVPVEAKFVVYNVGKQDLFIENVLPDCHCTVADYPKNPISPSDSAVISLKYDARNMGSFQSSAVVSTNSASSPTLLVFRGFVQ